MGRGSWHGQWEWELVCKTLPYYNVGTTSGLVYNVQSQRSEVESYKAAHNSINHSAHILV